MPFLFDDPVNPRLPAMEHVLGVGFDGETRIYPFAALAITLIVTSTTG